jgi:hypothetical protein
MKKLSILLIGLLLVTGFAFAQEVSVSGSATVTFGIDLDGTPSTGFENTGSSDINLVWLSGDASAGTQGWITISGWDITFDDDDGLAIDAGSVEAGWMFDPVTITIYSAPGFAGGEADGIGYEGADPEDVVGVALTAENNAGDPGFQGLTIDVALGVADLTLLVASDGTWVENDDNAYVFGAEVGATAGPATISAGVYLDVYGAETATAFDLGVGLTAGPATIGIGFDGAMVNGADLAWDAEADIGLDVAGIGVDIQTYFYTPVADLDMDLDVLLDLSGLVEALTFTELFETVSVLGAAFADWNSVTTLGYAVSDQVSTSATFEIDDASVIDLDVTVTLTGFVENTVFELGYTVDDLGTNTGAITFAGTITLP